MTKKLYVLAILLVCICTTNAQELEEFMPHGKIEGRIYTDFSADIVGDGHNKAFELKRAYFGYQYQITPVWRTHLRVDVGGSEFIFDGIVDGAVFDGAESQYVFFKTAALFYEKGSWFGAFGLHDTYQFKEQETLWGKRYILPSMLDKQKFDFSADIGASMQYSTANLNIDFGIFNGEGYKQLQTDDAFRGSLGITKRWLSHRLITRIYGDYSAAATHLYSVTGFIGADLDKFTFGAEYTYQNNYAYYDGHNREAYSLFTQYNIRPRIGLWARVDGMHSMFDLGEKFEGDHQEHIDSWLAKDGEDFYVGLEYVIVPRRINTSLNYQHHRTNEANPYNSGKIYFNLEVRF